MTGRDPSDCVAGQNFHSAIQIEQVESDETDAEIVGYCSDCDSTVTANVDLQHADSWFDVEDQSGGERP